MAGCDFSTRAYSYADFPGDVTLSNFSLTTEDFNYKVENMLFLIRYLGLSCRHDGFLLCRFHTLMQQKI